MGTVVHQRYLFGSKYALKACMSLWDPHLDACFTCIRYMRSTMNFEKLVVVVDRVLLEPPAKDRLFQTFLFPFSLSFLPFISEVRSSSVYIIIGTDTMSSDSSLTSSSLGVESPVPSSSNATLDDDITPFPSPVISAQKLAGLSCKWPSSLIQARL